MKKTTLEKDLVINKYSFIINPYKPEEYDSTKIVVSPPPTFKETVSEYRQ